MVNDGSCSDLVFVLENGDRVHAMNAFSSVEANASGPCSNEGWKRSVWLLLEYLYSNYIDVGIECLLLEYMYSDYIDVGINYGLVGRSISR